MSGYVRKFFRNRYVQALIAAVLVGGAVALLLVNRPVEYEGRVGLLAAPAVGGAATDDDAEFGAVVALSMPALVEVAHSPSLLAKASAEVPGAPDEEELDDNIGLEIVPASGLARLSVRADSPETASELTTLIARELIDANLLAPTATLRSLDTVPQVTEIKPDSTLAMGLALAAAVAAAVAVLALRALVRPAMNSRLRRALAASGVERPVALLQLGQGSHAVDELRMLHRASTRPLWLVPASPELDDEVDQLSDELLRAGVAVGEQEPGTHGMSPMRLRPVDALFVLLVHRRISADALSVAISAFPEPADLVAVVVSAGKPRAADLPDGTDPEVVRSQLPEPTPAPEPTRPANH